MLKSCRKNIKEQSIKTKYGLRNDKELFLLELPDEYQKQAMVSVVTYFLSEALKNFEYILVDRENMIANNSFKKNNKSLWRRKNFIAYHNLKKMEDILNEMIDGNFEKAKSFTIGTFSRFDYKSCIFISPATEFPHLYKIY